MKDMKRSVRRHHRARLISRWTKKFRSEWFGSPEDVDQELITQWAPRYARTQTVCSCLGCGNQRPYSGGTLPEKRSELDYKEYMGELE